MFYEIPFFLEKSKILFSIFCLFLNIPPFTKSSSERTKWKSVVTKSYEHVECVRISHSNDLFFLGFVLLSTLFSVSCWKITPFLFIKSGHFQCNIIYLMKLLEIKICKRFLLPCSSCSYLMALSHSTRYKAMTSVDCILFLLLALISNLLWPINRLQFTYKIHFYHV